MVPVTFTGDAVQCLSENQEGETEDEIIVAALAIHNGYDDNNGQRRWVTEVVTEKVEFVGSKNGGNSGNNSAGSGSGGGNTGSGGVDSPGQLGWGEEIVFDDNDIPF